MKVKRITTAMQYLIKYMYSHTKRSTTFIFSPSWQIAFDNEQSEKIEIIIKFYWFSITYTYYEKMPLLVCKTAYK